MYSQKSTIYYINSIAINYVDRFKKYNIEKYIQNFARANSIRL